MGWMRWYIQISSVLGTKKLHRQIAQPIRGRHRPSQDLPGFFFHRKTMLGRPDAKPVQDFIVKLSHAQGRQW